MTTLHERLPDVAKEFDRGSFVVHKSTRPSSAVAIDHAHEQNNAVVKGDGGAIGLTQNPRALLRWMVAGQEIARTIDGFETALDNGRHHEHTTFYNGCTINLCKRSSGSHGSDRRPWESVHGREENCGSVQRQISQIAWRSCAHPKAKLQSSTSSYWMELLSSTC